MRSYSTSQEDLSVEKRQIESQFNINTLASIILELKYSIRKGIKTCSKSLALYIRDILEIYESKTLEIRADSILIV